MHVPSHHYEFSNALGVMWRPIGLLCLACALWRIAAAVIAPAPPRWSRDFDRTLIAHQVRSCDEIPRDAVLLLGDSSCLMNVDASRLGAALDAPGTAVNLATVSYLGIEDHAGLLRQALSQTPAAPRLVVLLLHPQSVRGIAPSPAHQRFLSDLLAGRDPCWEQSFAGRLECWSGLASFRSRVLDCWIPSPLSGRYRIDYGFTRILWNHLRASQGSAFEPGHLDAAALAGDPEFRLARNLESVGAAFRAEIPAGTRVAIGITPLPASFALPNYPRRHAALLDAWSRALQPGISLSNLPAVLPDRLFATQTHLNRAGLAAYTRLLARELRHALAPETEPASVR